MKKMICLIAVFLGIVSNLLPTPVEAAEKQQRVVFVGDDSLSTLSTISDVDSRFTWIYEQRKGITWLKSQEKNFLKNARRGDVIVFSLGLSEVSNINRSQAYIQYFNKFATGSAARKGLKVYVRSIDNVDESKYGTKVNDKIKDWNDKVKAGLGDGIGYIDTNKILSPEFKTLGNGYYLDEVSSQKAVEHIFKVIGVLTDAQMKEKELAEKDHSQKAKNYWGKDKAGNIVYYDENEEIVRSTFKEIEGATYFFNKDGRYVTGLYEFEEFTMFFNDAGIMARGGTAKVDDEHYMLFDNNGHQLKDKWHTVNGKKYYIDKDGYALIGWWTIGTTDYYFTEDGSAATGITSIDGDVYWFNNDGIARVGWFEEEGQKYYFGEGGKMSRGHAKVEGKYYHFKEDGKMSTGWVKTAEGRFYYDIETGVAANGEVKIDGKIYHFSENGQLNLGWVTIGDDLFFYKEDGTTYVGKNVVGKHTYFFDKDGRALSGWQGKGKKSYYDSENYQMKTGWVRIKRGKYYFNEDGDFLTGLHKVDGSYHIFNSEGKSRFAVPNFVINLLILLVIIFVSIKIYKNKNELLSKFTKLPGKEA